MTIRFSYDKPGTGACEYGSLVARRMGNSDYRVKVRVTGTDGGLLRLPVRLIDQRYGRSQRS